MKNAIIAILLSFASSAKGQCVDAYGEPVPCPNDNDSLTVYSNALTVYQFYENSPLYERTRSREIITPDDKRDVFESLREARRMFYIIRREVAAMPVDKKYAAGSAKKGYVDIPYGRYYQEVDDYRFYQRELENQILNSDAPMSLYDTRISPIVVNEYRCRDTNSVYFGDVVNLPLYIPVVVKPYMLLTSTELELRNTILKIAPLAKAEIPTTRMMIKKTVTVKRTTQYQGTPIYIVNSYGSGALIGFMAGRTFTKIKPGDYLNYAVPPFGQQILQDDAILKKLLRQKFGGFFEKINE